MKIKDKLKTYSSKSISGNNSCTSVTLGFKLLAVEVFASSLMAATLFEMEDAVFGALLIFVAPVLSIIATDCLVKVEKN